MKATQTIHEPARDIPVFAETDVLVVGGGPAGAAAAVAAARAGAQTVLMERYGHLGGMSTGGLVVWIDRMSDWTGKPVITGFASDLLGRLPDDAILGAPQSLWGSHDPGLLRFWADRSSGHGGVINWSPTVDPEMLKWAYLELAREAGVRLVLHAWGVAPVMRGQELKGVICESKQGRQALLAKVVIDASGDGDIFAGAGAAFESDIDTTTIHHMMNLSFLWGGVDMERWRYFRYAHPDRYEEFWKLAHSKGIKDRPGNTPRNDVTVFMGPRLSGYSCLSIDDLSAVEYESRKRMFELLAFYREHAPGFEQAYVMLTSPQMGTRHSRRLVGVKKVTLDECKAGVQHADEIGVSPSLSQDEPSISIPYGCLVPIELDNLLAAGRNLSCDTKVHNILREVPQCWVLGQAAGVAAAVAVASGKRVRDVDIQQVQEQLLQQGAYLRA